MELISLKYAIFVIVLLVLYYCFPKKYRWYVLLAGSMAYYVIICKWYVLFIILAPCHTPMTINVMTLAMQPGSTLLICAPNLGFSHLPKFRKRFEIESG